MMSIKWGFSECNSKLKMINYKLNPRDLRYLRAERLIARRFREFRRNCWHNLKIEKFNLKLETGNLKLVLNIFR